MVSLDTDEIVAEIFKCKFKDILFECNCREFEE